MSVFEKVNPMHPDKVADRIAGAVVDMAYSLEKNPKIAVEVLIGHGVCHIIAESSVVIDHSEVEHAVKRITGCDMTVDFKCVRQDVHLAENQSHGFKCGDNGIFRGAPVTDEQRVLSTIARDIYYQYKSDGKYVLDGDTLIICQSKAGEELKKRYRDAIINPIGYWDGGTDVDTGATNRKLGSDMGDSVTGGGLHGKDLSKADVSVNIYLWLLAQYSQENEEMSCAIGDEYIDGVPYEEIVSIARKYIDGVGGFEKFAEWGLI